LLQIRTLEPKQTTEYALLIVYQFVARFFGNKKRRFRNKKIQLGGWIFLFQAVEVLRMANVRGLNQKSDKKVSIKRAIRLRKKLILGF
jgi:hypothetical protein